ncbi:integrase arm-type DNA-binding domain-containing protein [Klebsiella pneumoniae]|jgi:integrase|uniref:tyrosine-type recombinase/integrase n=1 Tax=Enterobacter cloacae complex TaxID=354276 RepID=UPI0007B339E0|nr:MULTISPECIES: integrase arm-type DNA-binding domain-containing protein [Enterobacter cloacae complex]EKW1981253.1 integrase arm-type DNA-binding domain-containing protein [Klebsiella pneumoniae]MCN8278070.1 integrase arm-type DNA-binding domain-containing protein [Escherichia coli]GBE69682.1 phage integrase [Enterobacter sp. KINAN-G]EHF8252946.1 integrase arm-type DNA-binding domain-containing protein [Enterobacter roggenkampii]EKY3958047.1 integrase arm-type DNA-binding domain-containing p
MSLTDIKAKNAKPLEKEYKLTDGFGMFLRVTPKGSKYWQMAYRFEGKQKLFSIGVYPAVSLSDARQRRDEARRLLAQGIDPNAKKQAEAKELKAKRDNTRSFRTVAKAWFATKTKWSDDYGDAVWKRLETYVFPVIGDKDVAELDTGDLLVPVKKVEALGYLEVAMRIQQYITAILRHAVQQKLIRHNPAYDMEGAVQKPQTEHRPALELEEIPQLLNKIAEYKGRRLTILAIQLNLMIFIRSSELRFARWSEIDFKSKLWVIPEQREAIENVKHSTRGAKMKRKHFVPLCKQAMKILKEIRQLTYEEGQDDGLIFTGCYDSFKPMSENTINKALRNMGYDTKQDICGHGFRTLACSALIESGLWSEDAVELQMSHKESNSVRAAYTHKAKHLDQRRLMLQWWADFLDANSNDMVRPFEFASNK